MRITVIKSDQKGIKALEFGRTRLLLIAIAAVMLVTLAALVSHYFTRWSIQQDLVSEAAIEKWQQELQDQKAELVEAKKASEAQVQALSSRLAIMQAHILRLDATGSRLAEDAGFAEDFGFGEVPAIGGPTQSPDAIKATYHDVSMSLDKLETSIYSKEQQLNALESLILDKEISVEQKISGRPIAKGWLSSPYGNRADPFTGQKDWHPGIDFAALAGTDVIATAAGVVTSVGRKSGYGEFIEISHGDGYTTRYGHNKTILVKKGDIIEKGQVIAKVGNTGRSTGPHVHYEVTRNGKKLNPYRYIKE